VAFKWKDKSFHR